MPWAFGDVAEHGHRMGGRLRMVEHAVLEAHFAGFNVRCRKMVAKGHGGANHRRCLKLFIQFEEANLKSKPNNAAQGSPVLRDLIK